MRGRVRSPLSHARTFGLLRTHLVCERPLSGDVDADRSTLLGALAAGAAWLVCPFVAPAHGARLWAERGDGTTIAMGGEARAGRTRLCVRLPTPADLVLLRDGAPLHRGHGDTLDLDVERAGVYRIEARIDERFWLLSNPIHLR